MVAWVNMLMLTGLAALSIPVVIHLLRNRRFEHADLGSLRFLQQVVRESSKWRRIRNRLLLFLRLLAMLLLVLLFSRPYLKGAGTAADRDADLVLLLDGSGSTRGRVLGQPLWKSVRQAGADVRATVAESAQLTTAVFADAVTTVKDAVPADLPAGAGTDYAGAMRWAADRLRTSEAAYREVVIVTDMQKSGLPAMPLQDWPVDVPVRIQELPAPGDFNLAIGSVRCLTPVPEGLARFSVKLVCSGKVPEDPLDLTFRIEGAKEQRRTVLPQTQEAIFSWDTPPSGICRGRAHIDADDGWPGDDTLEFAFELKHPLPIAVIDSSTPETPQERASYFLTTALSKERDGEGRATYDIQLKRELSVPGGAGAVIIAQPPRVEPASLQTLAQTVRAGAGLLVFLGDWMDADAVEIWREASLLPCPVRRTAVPVPEVISEWDAGHPLMTVFGSEESGDLARIVFRDAFAFDLTAGVEVVASLTGGEPAILTNTLGRGRIVVVSNPCSRAWTDWPAEPIYLPLVREMTAYVSGLAERHGRLTTRRASILEARAPGVHVSDATEVVFPHPEESRIERCSEEDFRVALGIGQRPESPLETPDSALPAGRQRRNELWRWLALGLAAVLFIESLTADWPSRRHRRQTSSPAAS